MAPRDFYLTISSTPGAARYTVFAGSAGGEEMPVPRESHFPVHPAPGQEGPARGLREVGRAATRPRESAAGRELFEKFIAADEPIRDRFRDVVDHPPARIWVRTDDTTVAALPWETLQRGDEAPFATRASSPVLRRPAFAAPEGKRRGGWLRRRWKWRVLVLLASPADLGGLDLAAEKGRLEGIFRRLERLRLVTWRLLENPTWEELEQALAERWDVLHFAGHGGVDSNGAYVCLCEKVEGRERSLWPEARVRAQGLANALGKNPRKEPPVFAFFNSCHGADAAGSGAPALALEMMKVGSGAVLAMQGPILDEDALELVRPIYDELARGGDLEAGVSRGRNTLYSTGRPAWWSPALYMTGELVVRLPWAPIFWATLIVLAVAAPLVWLAAHRDSAPVPAAPTTSASTAPAPAPPPFILFVEAVCDRPQDCGNDSKPARVEDQRVELHLEGKVETSALNTDIGGAARFSSPAESARVSVQRPGYLPFDGQVRTGETVTLCWRSDVCHLGGSIEARSESATVRWAPELRTTWTTLAPLDAPRELHFQIESFTDGYMPLDITLELRDRDRRGCTRTFLSPREGGQMSIRAFPRRICEERCAAPDARCNQPPVKTGVLPAQGP